VATTVCLRSSTASARPTARTVHSVAAAHHEAARAFSVAPDKPWNTSVERHPARRHAVGIELHLELAEVSAQSLHRGDARHRQQPVAAPRNSARSRSVIRSSEPASASSVNSNTSLQPPGQARQSGASVPAEAAAVVWVTRSATSWRERW
jgi:hypothetical protein